MSFKKYSLLFLLMPAAFSLRAQEQPDRLDIAERHFAKMEYSYAAPMYEKLANRRKPKADVLYKLAYCYDEMQQYDKALTWYDTYIKKDSAKAAPAVLRKADILKIQQRYAEAKAIYNEYLLRKPEDTKKIAIRINGCDSAVKWLQEKTTATVKNAAQLNTPYSDWGATFYGKELVFTSEDRDKKVLDRKSRSGEKEYGWTGNPFLRLFTTVPGWQSADSANVKTSFSSLINDHKYHVGPAAFSKKLDTVYFTITSESRLTETVEYVKRSRMAKYNLALFYSVKNAEGKWTELKPFAYNNVSKYSVGHAALNNDGSVLYFASDRPGGYGKTDIWYCIKQANGEWQEPQNCGPLVNTEEEEAFPTVGTSGQLFFSSKGLAGMGGFDIFVTSGNGAVWQTPQNLKPPFNSPYDDFYLTLSADGSGYLSSNRAAGKGSDDIYSFAAFRQVPPPTPVPDAATPKALVLKTIVMNEKDKTVIPNSEIRLTNLERGADWVKQSDAAGQNNFIVEKSKHYTVKAELKGFTSGITAVETLMPPANDTITAIVYMKPQEPAAPVQEAVPFKVGDKFVLENLHYDYDKHNIRPDAAVILDRLVATLNKYPGLQIELSSHTDSRGSDTYNMALSDRRAKAAVEYLVKKGINANRLKAKGYGESMLVNGCSNGVPCSVAEHQANRRTEVKILKID
ncbi:OmpA family protein [Sediminibacterium ginsengisoli]|uniref:WD40-like Beta Propeller Repeat n=1 Tax=Sediminibacterium ginsengisoli TaxID=413434 RepID=A0A1T4MDD6_9BACT|nr:OmpA family protein [Sediminibacterium ginsengisoli]SJZ64867.1 WD40-like Beta Propeller Repeat [Sediminibacterium ginsengisoli]